MLKFRDIGQFLLLLPLLVIALLHTDLGCFIVKKQIENELSSRAQAKIRIGKFDFSWPKQLIFHDLTVENAEGHQVVIKEITVDTSLTSLLSGNMTAATITLEGLHLMQAEVSRLKAQLNFNDLTKQWHYSLGTRHLQSHGAFSTKDENFSLEMAAHIPSLETMPWSLPDVSLRGECSVNVKVGGPWGSPNIQGAVAIRQGGYEHSTSGALFDSINADCEINNYGIRLKSFDAKDLLGGRVTATGDLKFDSEFLFPYTVNLQLENAAVVNLDDVRCHLSGDALFQGDRLGATISGELNADKVDIFLKDGKSSKIHGFDITYINQPIQEKPIKVINNSKIEWPIQLNLHLKSKGTILISDEQLTSQWKGDVTLTGTDESPFIQGDCRLLHGSYFFDGKKFDLTQGTIAFTGDPKKKTQLYVVGEQEVGSIHIEVILKGPLQDLSLAFRSTPQLSEKEILCHLLFGRGTGDITPFQGAELTESINKLKSQGGGGPNFLDDFKKRIGLDRIEISHGSGVENEDISLQVGKYLTPGVFVGVKKGITADANRIGIEADLRKNLKIQAEYGDDSEGHLHLKWKHDY